MDRRLSGPKRDWLTAEQAGEYMGVHEDTFLKLVADGKMPPGVQVSQGRKVWPWLDLVCYMHLASRMQGNLPTERPAKSAGS